jgi:hypothetical protein
MGVPAKRRRRRRRRPGEARRLQADFLQDAVIPSLNLEAPTGTYQIDRFFTELRVSGFPLPEEVPDEIEWIRKLINGVACKTIDRARKEIIEIPNHYADQKQKRELLLGLQKSVKKVQVAFTGTFGAVATVAGDAQRWITTTKDRLQELEAAIPAAFSTDREEYLRLTKEYHRLISAEPPCFPNELQSRVAALEAPSPEVLHEAQGILGAVRPTSTLQKCLDATYSAAEIWLKVNPRDRIASDNSPNKKPLLKWYISFSGHAWHTMTGHLPRKSEYDLFAKMLAAAWKDLGLDRYASRQDSPTKEYRWFRDRLEHSKILIHDFY